MPDRVPVRLTAQTEVGAPFRAEDLAEFIAAIPAEAEVMVAVFEVGQRDPVPSKFVFTASWSAERKTKPPFHSHPTARGPE